MFTHSQSQQRLSQRVIDLVRAGVEKVFSLEINLRAAGVRSEALRVKQGRWPAGVMDQQPVKFGPKRFVFARLHEPACQSFQRRRQSFRHVAPAKLAPVAVSVRFAGCVWQFLHGNF
jgi:hypothetical protein